MGKVIVAGSINMDIVALVEQHPKSGETVFGQTLNYFPGGKGANQAVSAARLGAHTCMVGKVGTDSFGIELKEFIAGQNVTLDITQIDQAPTGTALITVSKATADNMIVVIPGANFHLLPNDISKVAIEKNDILVSQFEIFRRND